VFGLSSGPLRSRRLRATSVLGIAGGCCGRERGSSREPGTGRAAGSGNWPIGEKYPAPKRRFYRGARTAALKARKE